MNRYCWLAGLLLLLWSCGGGGTPGARFGDEVFVDARGLDGASTLDLDTLDLLDLLDRKDLDLDLDSAITLDLDELDLLDELDRKDLDLDGGTEVLLPCGGLCSPYQICELDSNQCQDNELCKTDFCVNGPEGAWPVELSGAITYVDRYEWPNVEGQLPLGGVESAEAAELLCLSAGKRLCSVAELAAACSPGGQAYPYGNQYSATACNTELPFVADPCGANAACHAEGLQVFDLAGNVSEWTADGKLFGGTVVDGLDAGCKKAEDPAGLGDFALTGLRCCLSPTDDLDQDGAQASLDCDDLDGERHPGTEELCDGVDNDCDGQVDEAEDKDMDGWNACRDCNDKAASIHPLAEDLAGDGVDADCDGVDGQDRDSDGVASVESGGKDCDDSNAQVKPGEPDVCDGLDNDCNGTVDGPLPKGTCDDGNLCTIDYCDSQARACAGKPAICDDSNPCTDNSCDPATGCVFSNNNAVCTDKKACTENDQCINGACIGMAKDCDDKEVCTDDSCEASTGTCLHTANTRACQDADPCTTGDYCQDKVCRPGTGTLVCNDNNVCTTDACVPGTGCRYTPFARDCDDGDSCTGPDTCVDGRCVAGKNECECSSSDDCAGKEDGNYCNGTLVCNLAKTPHLCEVDPATIVKPCKTDQDSFCSYNACKPSVGLCYQTPRNEGLACQKTCTVNPVCKEGSCQGQTCAAAGKACANGVCISKTCAANSRICDGLFAYMVCNSGGSDWSASTSCGIGKYCDAGQCKTQLCTPGAPSCLGRLAGTCNESGSALLPGYTDCEALPATPFCQSGQCVACVPSCTGKTCGDDGCGGVCGVCQPSETCWEPDFACVSTSIPSDMVYIPAGTFTMGSPVGELGRGPDEIQHQVTLTVPFLISTTEVKQGEYLNLAGVNPSSFKNCGSTCPVEGVNWHDTLAYANKRSASEGFPQCFDCNAGPSCVLKNKYAKPQDCSGYRLPTEAEWEYAARAGTTSALFNGELTAATSPNLELIGWYQANAGGTTHPSGSKLANPWGLFDTSGNVWEWTWDWYGTYPSDPVTDPAVSSSNPNRVLRGGYWNNPAYHCRSAERESILPTYRYNYMGFRLVRSASKTYVCTPQCTGKVCGPDGCGGTCGTCADCGNTCSAEGKCTFTACNGRTCGDDGCGGKCGTCGPAFSCKGGICVSKWMSVTAGFNHSCGVMGDGTAWCWGANDYGQLGNGATGGTSGVPLQVRVLTGVAAVAAGYLHTCAIRTGGTAWCWGWNAQYQLGDGTTTTAGLPLQVKSITDAASIAAGHNHTCASTAEGTAWCWGYNAYGQIGDGKTAIYAPTPTQVSELVGVTSVATGPNHSCALRVDDSLWCWGENTYGQIGDGSKSHKNIPQQVIGLTGAKAVSAGAGGIGTDMGHSCGLKKDGTVWCWGLNNVGQLGDGTDVSSALPVQVHDMTGATAISAGHYHSCALKDDGTVWCWGANNVGQLGNGTTVQKLTPTQVSGLSGASAVAVGDTHACALKNDGTAWCWGANNAGQLGDGTTTNRLTPVQVL